MIADMFAVSRSLAAAIKPTGWIMDDTNATKAQAYLAAVRERDRLYRVKAPLSVIRAACERVTETRLAFAKVSA